MRWSYDVCFLNFVYDVRMLCAWLFYLVCTICICLEGSALRFCSCYISYDSLIAQFPCNRRITFVWFRLILCVGCHCPTAGHNLIDFPQLLSRGAAADTFPTKAKFAPNISWALIATHTHIWKCSTTTMMVIQPCAFIEQHPAITKQSAIACISSHCFLFSPALSTTVTLPSPW